MANAALYLKIMSDQDLPDSYSHKNFTMVAIPPGHRLSFQIDPSYDYPILTPQQIADGASYGYHYLAVVDPYDIVSTDNSESKIYSLTGNAYVLNADGRTIASHGA